MDILNHLPQKRFEQIDELLAFISIYEDDRRAEAYRALLQAHAAEIRDRVCVEGGCGLGLFAEEMARLGARKVYAVEQNPLLAALARRRFQQLSADISRRIELVESPLEQFRPPQPVDVLVHEFYGQLLYDEDLWVLEQLLFHPRLVLPDGGELLAGVVSASDYVDEVVSAEVLQSLKGVLVSGLFEERLTELQFPVLRWQFGQGLKQITETLPDTSGDLLCFGLQITHRGEPVCQAGECPNWAYVWTPRVGRRFRFRFQPTARGATCHFRWQ